MALVPQLLMEVFTAVAIGGLIGVEREHTENKKYAGVRTLSLLGGAAPGVVAISEKAGTPVFVAIYLALAAAFSLGIIAVRFKLEGENIGFTTSTAVFLVAVMGVLVGYDLYSEATSMAVIFALLLAEKRTLHGYVDKLEKKEISKALQLAALSFVLLPILPSDPVGPMGSIVPQKILLLAIFVLSIEFASYILMRQLSSTGIYLTGILGGIASSFATIEVMARLSKEKEELFGPLCSSANLSTVSMIVRNVGIATVILIPAAASIQSLSKIYLPAAAMLAPLLYCSNSLRENHGDIDLEINSPFSLKIGVKFAFIFILVSVASTVGQEVAGNTGVLATSLLGGLVSSTAVATSAATSFAGGTVNASTASGMILFSIIGSLFSKLALVEFTNKKMRRNVSAPMAAAIILGLVVLFLI